MVELPGTLQATFVPGEDAIAWWGVTDLEAAVRKRGLPEGRAGVCRLALPQGGRMTAATVPVRFAGLEDALGALRKVGPRARVGASVHAWRDAARLATRRRTWWSAPPR